MCCAGGAVWRGGRAVVQFRDVWARRPSDSLIGATAPAARRGEGKAGRRATVGGRGAGEVGVSVSISICNLFEV